MVKVIASPLLRNREAMSLDLALVFLGVHEHVFPNVYQSRYYRRKSGVRDDVIVSSKRNKEKFELRNAHQMDVLLSMAREQYRIKARELHPDTGGSHEEFVKLTRVWEYVQRRFKRWGIE